MSRLASIAVKQEINHFLILALIIVSATLPGRGQTVLWNEPVNGSLYVYSNEPASNAAVDHFVGTTNASIDLVEASTYEHPTGNGNGVVYPDFFSFTVPTGRELTSLTFIDSFNYSNNVYGDGRDYLQLDVENAAGNSLGFLPLNYGSGSHSILPELGFSDLSAGTYSLNVIGGYTAPSYEPQPTQNVVMTYTAQLDTVAVPEPSTSMELVVALSGLIAFRGIRRLSASRQR